MVAQVSITASMRALASLLIQLQTRAVSTVMSDKYKSRVREQRKCPAVIPLAPGVRPCYPLSRLL